jgi:hypothetical protein
MTTLNSCGQNGSSRTIVGEESARQVLEQILADTSPHNVVDNKKEIISDSMMAVDIAEIILFKGYGQENIKRQRPYEIYKIKNYWSISGTLPRNRLGGTFLIIMDARDGRIIKITHGK